MQDSTLQRPALIVFHPCYKVRVLLGASAPLLLASAQVNTACKTHLCMQRASKHQVHRVWEDIADEAGDAPMIRYNIVGQRGVLVVSPEAVAALLKRPKFIRKAPAIYSVFYFVVRGPAI